MVEFVLEEAADFKRSIDAISVLINEAELVVDSEGISLKATDPSQISMVDFSMKKDAFKAYKADGRIKIGLDLKRMSEIMSRAKAKDELSIKLDNDNNLKIGLKGASRRSFSLPLIDISSSELPTPKISFDAEVKVKAELLQDSFKDASLLSNHITLAVTDGSFILFADSSKGSFRNEVSKDDSSLVSLKAKSDLKSMFPLDYLANMIKAAQSSTDVSLSLKQDAPVKMQYEIGKATIVYFLAPRIEAE